MSTTCFKVATFNVNSIRSRIPVVIDRLREHGPDVLCPSDHTPVVAEFNPDRRIS